MAEKSAMHGEVYDSAFAGTTGVRERRIPCALDVPELMQQSTHATVKGGDSGTIGTIGTIDHKEKKFVTSTGNNESLSIEVDGNGTIVVHGDIDMAGGPALDAAIIGAEPNGPIIIDIGDVSFIDSSGLRSLLSASRRARLRQSSVTLRNVGAEVSRLFEITGTTDQFTIEI